MKICALAVAAMTLTSFTAFAQTNAAQASGVGTWKLDVAKSSFGSEPAPKAVTLTILQDTPELCSWRVDVVDDERPVDVVLVERTARREHAAGQGRPKVRSSPRKA